MIIPVKGVDTLADYERRRDDLDKNLRPDSCPACLKVNKFWRHGSYSRKVYNGTESVDVRINRFKCGNCGLVVSCVFAFLAPYVRFTVEKTSEAVQRFSETETTYIQLASELSDLRADLSPKPSSSQVFRWVLRVALKARLLLLQLQKELVMRSMASLLQNFIPNKAPNLKNARSERKKDLLQELSEFVQMAHLLPKTGDNAVRQIHAFFLFDVETLQSIFSAEQFQLQTTHYMKPEHC